MSNPRGLLPISIATLTPSAILGFEVFVRAARDLPAGKLFDSGQAIDASKLEEYKAAGVSHTFINVQDRHKYQEYLQQSWLNIADNDAYSVEHRLHVMGEVVRGVLDKEFVHYDTESIVSTTNQFAQSAVQLISSNDVALNQLFDVLHHDYGTFTHSTNVSLYCVLLAKELGFNRKQLQEIAVGGMLHDLGKIEIDSSILNKPGPLNLQEMTTIRRHPVIALQRLSNRSDVTFGQLMMAYQHHERLDGSGYPCHIPSKLIHPFAKICAVVDVFEAVTSQRPYRQPMQVDQAAQMILRDSGTAFDSDMAESWAGLVDRQGGKL